MRSLCGISCAASDTVREPVSSSKRTSATVAPGIGRGPAGEAAGDTRWRLPARIASARAAAAAIEQRYGILPATVMYNEMLEAIMRIAERVPFPPGPHMALSIFREMQARRRHRPGSLLRRTL